MIDYFKDYSDRDHKESNSKNIRTFVLVTVWCLGLIVPGLVLAQSSSNQQLAFPSAEGFGRFTSGGRGGEVYEVTNLNDSGEGSLRYAVEQDSDEPLNIIFRVSGTIYLKSELYIQHNNLSIFGQTAPGDGIATKGGGVQLKADNVIIQYVRFRPGDILGKEVDIWGRNNKNIIIDHCSFSWGTDEVASFYDNKNFTLQWSIISESLYHSVHHKGNHGYAAIWGGMGATFHHNLLADHTSRNPRFNGARYNSTSETEVVDFRNNVIFNWGFNSAYGGEEGNQNMVANYYKPGPGTESGDTQYRIVDAGYTPLGRWYITDNVIEGYPNVTVDNWSQGVQDVSSSEKEQIHQNQPFDAPALDSVQTAEEAFKSVLARAGAILPKRDPVDARIVHQVRTGETQYGGVWGDNEGIIDSQDDVGGWPELQSAEPPTDTDNDGIPDEWEQENGLDPNNPNDGKQINSSGYSNLESYIHSISGYDNFTPAPGLTQAISPVDESGVPVRPVFTWEQAARAASYQLQISTSVSGGVVLDTTAADTVYQYPDDIKALEGDQTYFWRVRGLNSEGDGGVWTDYKYFVTETSTAIGSGTPGDIPSKFVLQHNYPNPFNPTTEISYGLPAKAHVDLRVYNLTGQQVAQLVNKVQSAGYHSVTFNSESLASGVYIYQLKGTSGDQTFTQTYKMTLLK